MEKGKYIFSTMVLFTLITLMISFFSLISVNYSTDPDYYTKLSPNSTFMSEIDYKYSKYVKITFNNKSQVALSDTDTLNTYYLNTTNYFRVDSYYDYYIKIYFLKDSFFKLKLDNPNIEVTIKGSTELIDGWYKTLNTGSYTLRLESKDRIGRIKTKGALHLNKSLYNTTGLEICQNRCKTDKKFLVFASSKSHNLSFQDIFNLEFTKDINKIFNKIIVKFLYFYIALSLIVLLRIIYIFYVV